MTHLPAQPTPLIDRSEELVTAKQQLLSEGARLLTLIGPAGVGKTRLAVAIAQESLEAFPQGAWFVDFASLSDPGMEPSAIARTLGVREAGDRPLTEVLAEYLREKRVLLVLDNLEQLLPAAASTVADLLSACPNLKVLATSRERLRLRWEKVLLMTPLEVPHLGRPLAAEALSEVASAALFVERARAVLPEFALTAENAAAVAEICARLDGLPLAVELAAARMGVLTPAETLDRLGPRLPALSRKAPDAPERHRMLRAAFGWSYDLLTPEEQALFRRLGVLANGWTTEAAEAVGDAEGFGVDVLDALESLVDKSLIRSTHEANGQTRFGMLKTVREYALEQLRERGELESTRERHAAHFSALAERADPEVRAGPRQAAWQARLEREHDNLRAALHWASEAGRGEIELRLAAALAYFWYVQAHIGEGRSWLEHALSREAGRFAPARVEVLTWCGYLAWAQRDYDAAALRYEEALALARADKNDRASIFPLAFMGKLAWPAGDYERATALQEEALSSSRKVGDRWREAVVLAELAITRRFLGDVQGAEKMLEEAITLNQEVGNSYHLAQALATLADLVGEREDLARAAELLTRGVNLSWEAKQRGILVYAFSMTTRLVAEHGEPKRAARLLAAADGMDLLSGWRRTPPEAATQAKAVDTVRAKLRKDALEAESETGRIMALEQVVDEALAALALLRTTGESERFEPVATRSRDDLLSEREREVLGLLAEGLSDKQIAQKLFITERTVRFHVSSIRQKLRANTRAQAVAIAIRRNLL